MDDVAFIGYLILFFRLGHASPPSRALRRCVSMSIGRVCYGVSLCQRLMAQSVVCCYEGVKLSFRVEAHPGGFPIPV
jgi:hypothetical protein